MEAPTVSRIVFQSNDSLQTNISTSSKNLTSLADIIADCNSNGPFLLRIPFLATIIALAFPTNAVLLYVLLKNRKNLSPSEVLGLNFAILGVIYTLYLPFDIIFLSQVRAGLTLRFSTAFAVPIYFGCPLLLTSLCLERFVAVLYPVLFMKLGRWEYRAACSAIIWILTLIMATLMFLFSMANLVVFLSVILNTMFLTMVACLVGIMWALCQKGPGDAKSGEQSGSPMKKKAIKNIMSVLIPSFVIYFPMLALIPFLMVIKLLPANSINMIMCYFLLVFSVLPLFGVCLGPMFYIARIKKTLRGVKDED